jgi:hypothetical protein
MKCDKSYESYNYYESLSGTWTTWVIFDWGPLNDRFNLSLEKDCDGLYNLEYTKRLW